MVLKLKQNISIECPKCNNLVFNRRETKNGENRICLNCWANMTQPEPILEERTKSLYDPIRHVSR